MIAIALTLMGVRRSVTLFRVVSGDGALPVDITAELVLLLISALMFCGVIASRPLFKHIKNMQVQLDESERRFRNAFEAVTSGIVVRLDRLRSIGGFHVRCH